MLTFSWSQTTRHHIFFYTEIGDSGCLRNVHNSLPNWYLRNAGNDTRLHGITYVFFYPEDANCTLLHGGAPSQETVHPVFTNTIATSRHESKQSSVLSDFPHISGIPYRMSHKYGTIHNIGPTTSICRSCD